MSGFAGAAGWPRRRKGKPGGERASWAAVSGLRVDLQRILMLSSPCYCRTLAGLSKGDSRLRQIQGKVGSMKGKSKQAFLCGG